MRQSHDFQSALPGTLAGNDAKFFLPFFASLMSWLMILVCSMHQENPGMPAIFKYVSMQLFSTIYPEIRFANTDMYIFTSTFS